MNTTGKMIYTMQEKCPYVYASSTISDPLSLIRPKVIKHFSCSVQLSMKLVMLINLKAEHEKLSANYENANNSWHFHISRENFIIS